MRVIIKCKECKSTISEELKKGSTPTASMYARNAKAFGWVETETGYLCNYCLKQKENQNG
jgi:hypothetical protein